MISHPSYVAVRNRNGILRGLNNYRKQDIHNRSNNTKISTYNKNTTYKSTDIQLKIKPGKGTGKRIGHNYLIVTHFI